LPTSAASLVLAKSRGYTKRREVAPAAPPDAMFPKKNLKGSFLELNGFKYLLYVSLKAKFKAYVGKYLITFAKFPLQRDMKPYSLVTLEKQSPIPLYLWSSGMCLEAYCTYRSNLTLSIGATAVLETAAETPPIMKSLKKFPVFGIPSPIFSCFLFLK
jgi:hypothetical protein